MKDLDRMEQLQTQEYRNRTKHLKSDQVFVDCVICKCNSTCTYLFLYAYMYTLKYIHVCVCKN